MGASGAAGVKVARRVECVPGDGGCDSAPALSRSWKLVVVTVAGSSASSKVAVTVVVVGTSVAAGGGGDVGDGGCGRVVGCVGGEDDVDPVVAGLPGLVGEAGAAA